MRNLILMAGFLVACIFTNCSPGRSAATPFEFTSSPSHIKALNIAPEVLDKFESISEQSVMYGSGIAIDDLIIRFSDDENLSYEVGFGGLCDRTKETPEIILWRPAWMVVNYGNLSPMTEGRQVYSLYHLIGHCVFEKIDNAESNSLMNSNPVPVEINFEWIQYRYWDYVREFFDYYGPI